MAGPHASSLLQECVGYHRHSTSHSTGPSAVGDGCSLLCARAAQRRKCPGGMSQTGVTWDESFSGKTSLNLMG